MSFIICLLASSSKSFLKSPGKRDEKGRDPIMKYGETLQTYKSVGYSILDDIKWCHVSWIMKNLEE